MVELKKKVTLRAKTAETPEEVQKPQVELKKKQPETEPISPTPPTPGGESKGKGKWYAAALAGLLVLGGGGYYLSQQGEDDPNPVAVVTDANQSDGAAEGSAIEENQEGQKPEGTNPTDADMENPSDDATTDEAPTASEQTTDNVVPNPDSNTSSKESQPAQDRTARVNSVQQKEITGPSSATGGVEEEAKEVIRGKYGNGDVRKKNLGDRYAEIQSKVNEMYRNGQVN